MAAYNDKGKGTEEYRCTLSEETLEIAKKELNEDPTTRHIEIKTLRERLEKYPGLKPRLDSPFLLRFLRARKFDQERAFEMVLNYYRMRKEESAIFVGLKPSMVAHVFPVKVASPYPHRDRLGRAIYCIFPARFDKSCFTYDDMFKLEFINLSKMIEEEETQVRGFTLLVDYTGFGLSHALNTEREFVRRVSKMWADVFPGRMKRILIVNESTVIDMILALFGQFAKAKHMSRIVRIGTKWESLHEYIDPACLPACYGGTLTEDEGYHQKWVDQLLQCDREMEEESKFGFLDMELQQEKKKEDAFTNLAGTFKKLDA